MAEEMSDASPPAVNAKAATGNDSNRFAEDRHFFGMKAKGIYPQQDVTDDYEQRFPVDPMFEETGPNARVWRTYLVESMAFDENMVGEARDGLDAMLVFAGLFSAVVTSFLVQTSENLQIDYTQVSASLLSEPIAVQRASASGASVNAVPASSLNLNTKFVPDTLDVWVNGLWVVSLTLSLVVALSAVLIKQWLHRYIALRSGTPKDRSHIRHSRFTGFEKWQVLAIIGSLPVIMHLSLGLFLLGLVLFLIPLQLVLCCVIGGITFMVYILYITSNILPLFRPHCPYQTPLSDFLVIVLRRVSVSLGLVFPKTVANGDADGSLSVLALHWLFRVSTNPSVHSVVLQALGGLPVSAAKKTSELFSSVDVYAVHQTLLGDCTEQQDGRLMLKPGRDTVAERLLRTRVHTTEWWALLRETDNLMLFQEYSTEGRNPSFRASLLSSLPHHLAFFYAEQLKQFILFHHNIPHHPLVWKSLVRIAMSIGAFSDYQKDYAMFRILHPRFFGDTLPWTQGPTTLSQAVYLVHSSSEDDLHQELCEHLLELPVNDDALKLRLSEPARDTAEELAKRTMEFALSYVCAEPSNFDSAHWQFIREVLSNWNSLSSPPMFFKEVTTLLVEHTDICLSHPQGSNTFFEHRRVVLHAYHRYTWRDDDQLLQSYRFFFAFDREERSKNKCLDLRPDTSAVLRRTIEGSLFDLAFITDSNREELFVVFDILTKAIEKGVTSAYELFAEYNCLELCYKYLPPFNLQLLESWDYNAHLSTLFITGLASNTVDEATKALCIDYLFQPQNLRLAVLSYVVLVTATIWGQAERCKQSAVQGRVSEFVRLRPDESAWDDCRQWLHRVLKWVEGGRKVEELRDNEGLGEDWMFQGMLEDPGPGFIGYHEATEWFLHSLDECLAKATAVETATADAHPHTTIMPNPTAIVVNPTDEPEQARKLRWALPRIPKMRMFRGREREQERGPGGTVLEPV